MTGLNAIAWFFAGAFLVNAIPHFVSGVMGRAFQSPFATPRGVGLSSATLNVWWGAANLVVGYLLLRHVGAFDSDRIADIVWPTLGGVLMAQFLARRFGATNGGNSPTSSQA
jgi:hypothetical protein